MSQRPILEKKKNRLIRSLDNTPVGYIDLVDYVKARTRCSTSMAKKVLLSGSVMVDSHPVGFRWESDGVGGTYKALHPFIEAKHRNNIRIQNKVGK